MRVLMTAVVLCSSLLAGCATYADLRAAAPAGAEAVNGTPERIASCTLDKLQLRYASGSVSGQTFQKMDVGEAVHISSQLNGWTGPMNYLYVVSFEPAGASKTNVEVRVDRNYGGIPSDLWAMVDACAA